MGSGRHRAQRVLLTRTEPGASRQAQALCEAGFEPVKLPLLDIEPVACQVPSETPDIAIALSAHAVTHGSELIAAWRNRPTWLAVGKATARSLAEAGIDTIHPSRASSEGLLALHALAGCRGCQVGILCGESPRALLREVLTAKGAHVTEYPVYRRLPLERNSDYHAHFANLSAVVVSSVEGLQIFTEMWNTYRDAAPVVLCVNSERVAMRARELGFDDVRIAPEPTGRGLARALAGWLRRTA